MPSRLATTARWNASRRRGPRSGTDDGTTRSVTVRFTTKWAVGPWSLRYPPPRSSPSARATSATHATASDPPETGPLADDSADQERDRGQTVDGDPHRTGTFAWLGTSARTHPVERRFG